MASLVSWHLCKPIKDALDQARAHSSCPSVSQEEAPTTSFCGLKAWESGLLLLQIHLHLCLGQCQVNLVTGCHWLFQVHSLLLCPYLSVVLGIRTRTLIIPGKLSVSNLHPQLSLSVLLFSHWRNAFQLKEQWGNSEITAAGIWNACDFSIFSKFY